MNLVFAEEVNLGVQLRTNRIKKGFSIKNLSKKSGISESTILATETGKTKNMRIDNIIRLASVLNISLEEIIVERKIMWSMDYNLERIGNNLKKLRIKRKWKFAYISKQTEIDEDRLRRMELTYRDIYRVEKEQRNLHNFSLAYSGELGDNSSLEHRLV